MRIEGRIKKSDKWWAVEVPLLSVFTQGRTKKDAYNMVIDAIESLVDKKGFRVDVQPSEDNTFSVGANDEGILIAFALKQQRAKNNLSIRDVSEKMGSKSPSAYSRYEVGTVKPSLDKFSELLRAINEELEPVLKIG